MILYLELGIIILGIIMILLQKKINNDMGRYASKLVYWTVLLFIAIVFNGIQFAKYPYGYSIDNYIDINSIKFIIIVVLVFTVVQILSPSKLIERIKEYFKEKKREERKKLKRQQRKLQQIEGREHLESLAGGPPPKINKRKLKEEETRHREFREEQFEIFIETICWIGILLTIALEGSISHIKVSLELQWSIINSVCAISVVIIPIILRQIIFYVVKIKRSKFESKLTEREGRLMKKLTNENNLL